MQPSHMLKDSLSGIRPLKGKILETFKRKNARNRGFESGLLTETATTSYPSVLKDLSQTASRGFQKGRGRITRLEEFESEPGREFISFGLRYTYNETHVYMRQRR